MNLEYVKRNLRLFDELIISEIDLSKLCNSYIFPKTHYLIQLRSLGIDTKNLSDSDYQKLIYEKKDKIKFRSKHIIFMGYKTTSTDDFVFLQLTTVEKSIYNFPVYYQKIPSYKKVLIKTNKLYFANLKNLKYVEYSRKNRNKGTIFQQPTWKNDMLSNLTSRTKKSLLKLTSLKIYE